ncbi:MAG: PorV/PorQ family protein [Candidatus Saganbacteria bacterium]|nr:PorV/PorQ family protein [Candidatus Saganbacteria bacterium]
MRPGSRLIAISLLCLALSSTASAQTAFDPMAIGVGARALGMGRAAVAVAEHGDTIFTNPAGLGEIDSFEFSSMSARLLDEVNYTLLGGVYPLGDKSALGLGYVVAGVSDIELRDSSGALYGRSNYSSSILFISFGRKLTEKLSLGLNLKYYSDDGHAEAAATGRGVNLDVGVLQQGLGWTSFGVVGQNILSNSSMLYDNAAGEELTRSVNVGTRLFLLGENIESAFLAPVTLTAALDANISLQAGVPTTTHAGLELMPHRWLILRTGLDQDPGPNGLQTNPTYGLSLQVAGVGFHFAYHRFNDLGTSFFSLSFDEKGWPFEGLPDRFLGQTRSRPLQI